MGTSGKRKNFRRIIQVIQDYFLSLLREKRHLVILTGSFLFLLVVIFLFPIISTPGYSIISKTINEFGSQSASHSWILFSVYVSLAAGSLTAGWRFYEGFVLQRFMLVVFAVCLVLAAFFIEAPVSQDTSYNMAAEGWHAYFEGAAVLSFLLLSLSTAFIREMQQDRLIAVTTGISLIILSILKSEAEQFGGIWQRLIFIIMFGWQLYTFRE